LLVALITAIAFLLARLHPSIALAGSAVGVACGLILGCASGIVASPITHDRLPWVPVATGWNWLLWMALAAIAIDAVARLPRVPAAVGWALRGMLSAGAGWALTAAGLRDDRAWSPVVLGMVILAQWAVLEQVGRLDRRGLVPLLLVPPAMVAAMILIGAGGARFGFTAMVLQAILLGSGLTALAFGRETNGLAGAVAVLFPGLVLSGYWEYEPIEGATSIPVACFVLVALSPLAFAPLLLPVWRRYQKQGLFVVQTLLLMIPVVTALYLAMQAGALDFE
jgi:hypothetical protein